MPYDTAEKRNAYFKKWYAKNKRKHIAYVRAYGAKNVAAFRELIRTEKAKPCVDCNGTFPSEAMDFDHVLGEKIGNVSQMNRHTGSDLARIREEISKCEVVCANCHRVRTEKRRREKLVSKL